MNGIKLVWTNGSIIAYPALTALSATWNKKNVLELENLEEEARYRKKDILLGWCKYLQNSIKR